MSPMKNIFELNLEYDSNSTSEISETVTTFIYVYIFREILLYFTI